MTERKEPTISAIRPDPDEIARRQRPSSGANRAVKSDTRAAVPAQPASSKPSGAGVSIVGVIALLVAFVALGGVAYMYQQNQLLVAQLSSADSRIVDLEKQLEMTGDESTASMAAVQAKLKWADSEIRKLWGVSYDTNRKAIAANTGKISALTKSAGSVDSKIATALKGPKADIKLINDLIEGQQSAISSVETRASQGVAQVQALTDTLRKMEKSEAALQSRIKTNEEAIEAIDAFRRTVNQQLLQLRAGSTAP